MRLVDFINQILKAHADTLVHLAAFLGEEVLVESIENAPELLTKLELNDIRVIEQAGPPQDPLSLQAIQGTVHDLGLPQPLEFYLWAYPFYRALIESSFDLNLRIDPLPLIEKATDSARAWVRGLPLPPALSPGVERTSETVWLKFRSEMLKKAGVSRLQAVKVPS